MTFEECVENLTPTKGVTLWRQIWNAAYKEGQEDMRERACKGLLDACESFENDSQWGIGYVEALGDVLEGIRALEIKGEGE